MLAAIEGMIAELRQIGVPVSLAERIDAVHSLRHLPVGDRATVKAALRAVLVKTHEHELAFDAVFDLYFTPPTRAGSGPARADSEAASTARMARAAQGVQGGLSGQNGHGGGGGLGALDDAALTDLLLTALREGNEVMMRALAGMFVDRHAGIEPGRPVAGTYYVFRTLRAVDPDRLLARLAEPPTQPPGCRRQRARRPAGAAAGARGRYEDRLARFRQMVEAAGPPAPGRRPRRRGRGPHPAPARCPRTWTSSPPPATRSPHMRAVLDPLTRKLADPAGGQAPRTSGAARWTSGAPSAGR